MPPPPDEPSGDRPKLRPDSMRIPFAERAVYVISVAADLAGVHPQTLRMYERKGLLSPKRTAGNTRRYSEQDVERLRQIQHLTQDDGVNLAGVRIIMEMQRQLDEMRVALERTRLRLAQEAAQAAAEAEANPPRVGRLQWGVLARLDDVRNIYGPTAGPPGRPFGAPGRGTSAGSGG